MNGHPRFEEWSDLLDQRVSGIDRDRLEEHLAGCDACRGEWERLTGMRTTLRRSMEPTEEVPESLRVAIAASLDQEDRSKARAGRLARLAGGLAAAAVVLWGVIVLQRGRTDLPAGVVQDHAAITSGQRPLEFRTADAAELDRWFNERLAFPSRVFDLTMMRYHLVGGRIDSLKGRRSALFVYRHESGEIVICEMFEGRTETLPEGALRRSHDGIEFFIYQRAGATAVFWQEGAVVCVLAGRVPQDEIVALAFAKAMKPRQSS